MRHRRVIALIALAITQTVKAGDERYTAIRYMRCSASLEAIANGAAQGARNLPAEFRITATGLAVSNLQDQFGNYLETYRVEIDRSIDGVPATFEMTANMDRIERLNSGNQQYSYFYRFIGGLDGYMLNPSLSLELSYGQTSDNGFGHIRLENAAGLLAFYSLECGQIK